MILFDGEKLDLQLTLQVGGSTRRQAVLDFVNRCELHQDYVVSDSR